MGKRIAELPRVFSRAEALRAGVTRAELGGPGFHRIMRGAYVRGEDRTHPDVRWQAALLAAGGRAQLTGADGLALLGAYVPRTCAGDSRVHVLIRARDPSTRIPQIRVHRTEVTPEPRVIRGMRCAPAPRCWLDLATHPGITLENLVVTADSLMRWKDPLAFESDLVDEIDAHPGCPGIRIARKALTLAHSGTDSPQETVLRLRLVLAGLPCPVVNHDICGPSGYPRYRLDLAWPEARLGIEYDGVVHVGDRGQMERDRTRRRHLEDWGWRIVTVTAADLRDPDASYIASCRRVLGNH